MVKVEYGRKKPALMCHLHHYYFDLRDTKWERMTLFQTHRESSSLTYRQRESDRMADSAASCRHRHGVAAGGRAGVNVATSLASAAPSPTTHHR